jgi:hypothetical protein
MCIRREGCLVANRSANQHRIVRAAHEQGLTDAIGETPAAVEVDQLRLADKLDAVDAGQLRPRQ